MSIHLDNCNFQLSSPLKTSAFPFPTIYVWSIWSPAMYDMMKIKHKLVIIMWLICFTTCAQFLQVYLNFSGDKIRWEKEKHLTSITSRIKPSYIDSIFNLPLEAPFHLTIPSGNVFFSFFLFMKCLLPSIRVLTCYYV